MLIKIMILKDFNGVSGHLKHDQKETIVNKRMHQKPEANVHWSEAVARRCSVKKVFLRKLQIHRKTPVSESGTGAFL